MPVVIAYDGSAHAKAAIERAGALLGPTRALVLSAWPSFEESVPGALLAMPAGVVRDAVGELDADRRENAERLAGEGAELARAAGFDAEPRAVKAAGPYFEAIVRCADEVDADVIVIGSRGRSRLAAAFLGSVSTGVINHARRPVLIAHAED